MRVKGRALAWFGAELHIGGADLGGEHSKETARTMLTKHHNEGIYSPPTAANREPVPKAQCGRFCGQPPPEAAASEARRSRAKRRRPMPKGEAAPPPLLYKERGTGGEVPPLLHEARKKGRSTAVKRPSCLVIFAGIFCIGNL